MEWHVIFFIISDCSSARCFMECKCFQNVLKHILEEMGRILNFKNVYLVYSFLDYYTVVLLVKSVDEAL